MKRRPSVFEMIHQVVADSQEQLVKMAATGDEKVESEKKDEAEEGEGKTKAAAFSGHLKVAEQCEFLADNLHLVEDQRTPAEKLAEHIAIQQALLKSAEEMATAPLTAGVAPGGSHSAMLAVPNMTPGGNPAEAGHSGEATSANQGEKVTKPGEHNYPTDAGNLMPTNLGMMAGEQPVEVLKQSSDAQALAILQHFAAKGYVDPEKVAELEGATVDPGWWASQKGMARAMRREGSTGLSKALADPTLIGNRMRGGLKGALVGGVGGAGLGSLAGLAAGGSRGAALGALLGGGLGAYGGEVVGMTKADTAHLRERGIDPRVAGLLGARFTPEAAKKYQMEDSNKAKKASSEVPQRFARALLGKFAADAENPAQISAGSTPALQAAAGEPPVVNQGSETGEMTPRQFAPTSGQGDGRQYVGSNDAAIGYTKGEAKRPQKRALGEVVTEPALSAAHDHVLAQSLDNTSSAGVKISAARNVLKKVASTSPANRKRLDEMIKAAIAGEPIPAPGAELGGAAHALAAEPPPVSDAALSAAAEGVTTDQLATAQQMLAAHASQMGEAAASSAAAAPTGMGEGTPAPAGGPAMM